MCGSSSSVCGAAGRLSGSATTAAGCFLLEPMLLCRKAAIERKKKSQHCFGSDKTMFTKGALVCVDHGNISDDAEELKELMF